MLDVPAGRRYVSLQLIRCAASSAELPVSANASIIPCHLSFFPLYDIQRKINIISEFPVSSVALSLKGPKVQKRRRQVCLIGVGDNFNTRVVRGSQCPKPKSQIILRNTVRLRCTIRLTRNDIASRVVGKGAVISPLHIIRCNTRNAILPLDQPSTRRDMA